MIRHIMPWQATGPGDVTILATNPHARKRRLLTKVIAPDGIRGYDREVAFVADAVRLDRFEDLAELIGRLAGDPYSCIVRGVLLPAFADRQLVLRRSNPRPGEPERFAPASRRWLVVDVDDQPCPPGVDPCDPIMAGGALRRLLPPPLQMARALAQLSSTAGLEPGVLKGHLAYWLDRPISDAEAKRWLGGAPVDLTLYNAVQVHYVASPVFEDSDDPCAVWGRLAVLPGYAEVAVPALVPERPRQSFKPAAARPYAPPPRRIGTEAPQARRYMLACTRALAGAPFGHGRDTCMRVALRLYGMAKAGLLDPADITARLKGTMVQAQGWSPDETTRGRTLADVNRQLQWAWDHAEPQGLRP